MKCHSCLTAYLKPVQPLFNKLLKFHINYPFILFCSCLFLSFSSLTYRISNDTYTSLSHGNIASISLSEYLWWCISAKLISKNASRLLWERPIRKNLATRWRWRYFLHLSSGSSLWSRALTSALCQRIFLF